MVTTAKFIKIAMLRHQTGFSYLGVLLLVAILGASLASVGQFWHTAQLREKEKELLFVGNAYRRAIQNYYVNTPGPVKQYPRELRDLVLDPRQQAVQRYLRKLFRDPITGKDEWGLVKNADGSIMGVYSLSEDSPMKVANFSKADAGFEKKQKYSEWKFVFLPTQTANQPVIQGARPLQQGNPLTPQTNPFARPK